MANELDTKSTGESLKEKLFSKKKNVFECADSTKRDEMYAYAEGYKQYLDDAKTEREAVDVSIDMLEKAGYRA